MADFKSLYINSLLIGLVIVGMFAFVVELQTNYNPPNPVSSDSRVSFIYNLTNNLNGVSGNSNNASSALYSTSPSVDTGGLMLTTIVGTTQLLFGSIYLVWYATIGGLANVLGFGILVTTIFTAILIGLVILLAWSVYRLGR